MMKKRQVVSLLLLAVLAVTPLFNPGMPAEAREMIGRIPNNHLQYAITWYGFAVVLLIIFGVFTRGRLRESNVREA